LADCLASRYEVTIGYFQPIDLTRYNMCCLSLGEGDETALQTRRQINRIATSQDDNAKAPQCAKGHAPSWFLSCQSGN
jgi:hypothetical protein